VAEKSSDVRDCARRSTTSAEGAELTGLAHDTQREERGARDNGSATGDPGPRDRERERGSMRAKETSADRSAPLGSEREREGAREGELPLTGGVRLSGRPGAWARGLAGPAGLLSPFLFLWIL
jgi:hypothetical protein